MRRQRNYARFMVPKPYRTLSNEKKYLVVALGSGEPHIIRQRAALAESVLVAKMVQGVSMTLDRDKFKVFDIVLNNGTRIENINSSFDVDNLLKIAQAESLADLIESLGGGAVPQAGAGPQGPHVLEERRSVPATQSLPLVELLDKFILLKKPKTGTVTAYKSVVKEFTEFCKSKCPIAEILQSDVTRFREELAKKNGVQTIDNKMKVLKSLLNFAIDQGYLNGKNPVSVKNLQTKKQKLTEGYAIFESDEIKLYFQSERFKAEKKNDPDYYFCLMLEIFTGCRVNELTSLQINQLKKSESGTNFLQIRDSKTAAGKREIPIPEFLFEQGFSKFIEGKNPTDFIFRYLDRDGRGAGNAVGKKFSYQIKLEKIHRPKLVFHSLRKFLNDFFMKNSVDYEVRCQYFGHEIEAVNVATYTNKFNVDDLYSRTNEARKKVASLIGF